MVRPPTAGFTELDSDLPAGAAGASRVTGLTSRPTVDSGATGPPAAATAGVQPFPALLRPSPSTLRSLRPTPPSTIQANRVRPTTRIAAKETSLPMRVAHPKPLSAFSFCWVSQLVTDCTQASPSAPAGQKTARALMQPSGITISVSSVETITPNSSEMAIPWKMGSKRMTLEPATRARAVITIGRVLVLQASTTASRTSTPSRTRCREKSTSKMELRTMMPANAMKPIMDVAVNSAFSSQWPGIIPISVSGIGAMITAGTTKLPNSQTTRM